MFIGTREILIKPYTRAIARAVNEKMLEGVNVGSIAGEQTMNVPAVNADRSEQLLIKLMSGLTDEEIDGLLQTDYLLLKKEIQDWISGEKK